MSAGIAVKLLEMGYPENLGLAFGSLIVGFMELELQLLQICRPPSCVSGVGRCREVFGY
jgi:hypothetical protein